MLPVVARSGQRSLGIPSMGAKCPVREYDGDVRESETVLSAIPLMMLAANLLQPQSAARPQVEFRKRQAEGIVLVMARDEPRGTIPVAAHAEP
jgi:hypothetical protein